LAVFPRDLLISLQSPTFVAHYQYIQTVMDKRSELPSKLDQWDTLGQAIVNKEAEYAETKCGEEGKQIRVKIGELKTRRELCDYQIQIIKQTNLCITKLGYVIFLRGKGKVYIAI
jgi:hypothetical protein